MDGGKALKLVFLGTLSLIALGAVSVAGGYLLAQVMAAIQTIQSEQLNCQIFPYGAFICPKEWQQMWAGISAIGAACIAFSAVIFQIRSKRVQDTRSARHIARGLLSVTYQHSIIQGQRLTWFVKHGGQTCPPAFWFRLNMPREFDENLLAFGCLGAAETNSLITIIIVMRDASAQLEHALQLCRDSAEKIAKSESADERDKSRASLKSGIDKANKQYERVQRYIKDSDFFWTEVPAGPVK